jgi:hypothetical protein
MQNFEKLAEINAVSEKIKSFKKDATELALRKKKLITVHQIHTVKKLDGTLLKLHAILARYLAKIACNFK